MPRQTSVQITDATQQQINRLQSLGFGSFTDIVRIAIDRMTQQESSIMSKQITFTDWSPDGDYNYLHTADKYHYGAGWIPEGTVVQFVADNDLGYVVLGNGERSLVSYKPDRLTGMSEARDWFPNDQLRVPVA